MANQHEVRHFFSFVQERFFALMLELGGYFWSLVELMGGVGMLTLDTGRALFKERLDLREIVRLTQQIGVQSLSLVSLIAVFTGMVMALQFIVGLNRFGLELYTGQVVGIGITRELGPVLTALMVAARVGSGMAAELGSMTVSEQVLAIEAMGGAPVARLVVPRVLVTTLATPLLTVVGIFIGIMGGMFVTMLEAGISAAFYIDQITQTLKVEDFFSGVSKTVFFGFMIGVIACYKGLATKGGTQGVGHATTHTVVVCSVAIFVADFFLTKLFLLF